MAVFGWVLPATYLVGWIGFSVTITRFLSADEFSGAEDVQGRALLAALGMILAVFWPLVIPGGWVYKKAFGVKKS